MTKISFNGKNLGIVDIPLEVSLEDAYKQIVDGTPSEDLTFEQKEQALQEVGYTFEGVQPNGGLH